MFPDSRQSSRLPFFTNLSEARVLPSTGVTRLHRYIWPFPTPGWSVLPSLHVRRSRLCDHPGPPPLTQTTFLACCAHYPGGPIRADGYRFWRAPAPGSFRIGSAFPAKAPGRHPHRSFRGLLELYSRYGPPSCSPTFRGLCREVPARPVSRPNRSPAIESNHQLFEWVLPPLVICPFGAHALAPGDGKTCSQCSCGQHPEFSAYVLRHHQDQPRPRPVAVGTECHVDDRRASLLRSGQEIPAPRLCRNARPSAFIGDGRRRHDGGKGHAVSQGRILIPLEEGMRSLGRGLAAWLLRDARGVSAELHQASGIHSGEPGEGGTGREARGVPLLFHVPGKEEGSGG